MPTKNTVKPSLKNLNYDLLKDFIVHTEGGWEIGLAPCGAKCGLMSFWVYQPPMLTHEERYEIRFSLMHRRFDDTPDWREMQGQRPDLAEWVRKSLDLRFPPCEVCNEQWRNQGCP